MGFSVMLSEVPKNWCLPNTGALTVHEGVTVALVLNI